jgi:hypothetical protein
MSLVSEQFGAFAAIPVAIEAEVGRQALEGKKGSKCVQNERLKSEENSLKNSQVDKGEVPVASASLVGWPG